MINEPKYKKANTTFIYKQNRYFASVLLQVVPYTKDSSLDRCKNCFFCAGVAVCSLRFTGHKSFCSSEDRKDKLNVFYKESNVFI